MTLTVSFLARKIWFMSGKHLIRLPEEYAGLLRHGQRVEVEIRLASGEAYRPPGIIKVYRRGTFVKLPPEARALLGERGLRVRIRIEVVEGDPDG